jgi:hypothetical protein
MKTRRASLVIITAIIFVFLLIGITLSTAAANSGYSNQDILDQVSRRTPTPSLTPTKGSAPTRPGPIVLQDFDRDYEEAIAELVSLELIPEGGRLIFETNNANRFGSGNWFIPLAEQRPHTNFVMAGDITFTLGGNDEFETCTLVVRLNLTSNFTTEDYIDVGFDNLGSVFVYDLFDASSRTGYTLEFEPLFLDYDEPHHLLFFMLDDTATVFVDGELALEEIQVEERRGSYGLALVGSGAASRCDADNIWIWELDSAWRGEEGVCGVSASSQINKRGGPGTNFEIVGQLPANEVANVDGQTEGNDGFVWYHLTDDSWVRSDLIEEIGVCENAPTIEP